MHFQMKIQPIDQSHEDSSVNYESPVTLKPVLKSRFKRLFERGNLKHNSDKPNDLPDFEPSSVCLAKMVQNFIEDEKPKCGRNRCNCFNGNMNDVSDDEFFNESNPNYSDTLKSLTSCANVAQRNLLADTSKIVEKNKFGKIKDELTKGVVRELVLIGYDASICKSRWEKTSSYPAGEYEFLDVMFGSGERVLIDIDFRSEFEIARPTGNYKAILQSLPYIYVGEADRLQQILSVVSDAAKLSLKKKGMHVPPWRKFEYMKSKWMSTHVRMPSPTIGMLPLSVKAGLALLPPTPPPTPNGDAASKHKKQLSAFESECGVFELIFGEDKTKVESKKEGGKSDEGFESSVAGTWEPPAIKPRNVERGSKLVVTGLASLFREKA
nr:hypothetical protein [Tanacetum cinerariifolium]